MRGATSAGCAAPGCLPRRQDAAPTQEIPAPSYAPPRIPGGNNRALPLILGLAAVLLVLAGIGAIVGFALVGGDGTNVPQSSANEPAPAEDPGPTRTGDREHRSLPSPRRSRNSAWATPSRSRASRRHSTRCASCPTTDLDQPIQNPDNRFLAADLTFENVSEETVSVSSLLEFVLKNEEGYSASQTVHTQQRELAEGEICPGREGERRDRLRGPPGVPRPPTGLQTLRPRRHLHLGHRRPAGCRRRPRARSQRLRQPPDPEADSPHPRAHEQRPAHLRDRGRRSGRGLLPGRGPRGLGLHLRQPRRRHAGHSTPKTSGTSRTSTSPTPRASSSPPLTSSSKPPPRTPRSA